jgi:hypothetical protein
MDLLELLATCIEQGRTAIAPALVSPIERERLDQLRQLGAMTLAPADVIFCPHCEIRTVRVLAVGSGFCIDCGLVSLTARDTLRLAPDGDWLRRRMAQALGLAGEPAWVIVPGRVWKIGDVRSAAQRRRVLFGQQLTDIMVLKVLLTAWPTHVGETQAVIVTTSPPDRVFLPGVPATLVPLPAAFRLRGGGLVADEAVWAGFGAPTGLSATLRRHGPFSHDFREVTLPGEETPIQLTPAQAAIMRVLWKLEGAPIDRKALIRLAGVELTKPVDAFARNKHPEANRAYHMLVRSDRRGRYWLPLRPDSLVGPNP